MKTSIVKNVSALIRRWLVIPTIVERFVLWFFLKSKPVLAIVNIGGLIGLAYLVADTYFQTEAAISSAASDPKDPFYFPFSVVNNSHLFSITNVKWTCKILYLINDKPTAIMDSQTGGSGFLERILPNGVLNIDCSGFTIAPTVTEASVCIELSYNTSVFGVPLPRTPPPTEFSWYGRSTNPQWIKGTSLRKPPANLPPRLRYDPKTNQIVVRQDIARCGLKQ
jgi:hypothetical protein